MIHITMMRFLIFLSFLVFLTGPAYAEAKPDLSKVEQDLSQQKALQQKIAKDKALLADKLAQAQRDLLKLTRDIQTRERAVLKLQDARAKTQQEYDAALAVLQKRRQSLAQLIMALQRLNRMPPQMLLVRPSAPIDTARSFTLMQEVMPVLSAEAGKVKTTLAEMDTLKANLLDQQDALVAEQKELAVKQVALEKNLARRKTLWRETDQAEKQVSQKVAALSRQAKDIRDLLSRLDAAEKQDRAQAAPSIGQRVMSWLGTGPTVPPVEGRISTPYGGALSGGGKSQGVTIAATSGAVVVSPGAGVVRFAGPFRQYKLLVIVQHKNGDHSLIGGLQELYTRTGENVTAGEPIGKLPGSKMVGDNTRSASLYYERRRNGKPIDPRSARG